MISAFSFILITIVWIVIGTTKLKLHPFLVLITGCLFLAFSLQLPFKIIPQVFAEGFGKTFKSIGLLVLYGTIIGIVLEKTKATHSIANALLKLLYKLPLPFAVSCIGYVVSIPVFCDSAFVILSSLNKSLAEKTNSSKIALTIALSTGLFAPHVLVPPTPGPLAAAANLEMNNLFLLICVGGILAFILILVGAFYAHSISEKSRVLTNNKTDKKEDHNNKIDTLPPLGISLAPIILPIVLMAFGTLLKVLFGPISNNIYIDFIELITTPSNTLLIGVLFSFVLLKYSSVKLKESIELGIKSAVPILIITGTGGILGEVIQQIPIASYLENTLINNQLGIVIPFLIAAVLKTAQGSSTVAIITTSSIVFPLLAFLGMDSELGKVWVIMALGVGSMTVSHANDSYFWIVSQIGGLDIKTAYRHHTWATFLQGITGFIIVWIGYNLWEII
ncbi:GntP family permease [Flavobacteriaceae bacterium]|nr:GntP family permease [Flavobacteriaceae bacterium]